MADLMVKGLTPNVSNGVSEINGSDKKTNKDAEPVFASLMCNVDSTKTQDSGVLNFAKVNMKSPAADNSFTPDTLKNKVVKDQPEADSKFINEDVKGKLQEINDKIKTAVMEEYDISEEELDEVMETLGLEYIQLLLPENLVKLSVEITGAPDSLGLLSDPGFNQLYGMMQDLTAQLTQDLDLPVTPETVNTFAEMLAPQAETPVMTLDSAEIQDMESLDTPIFAETQTNVQTGSEAAVSTDAEELLTSTEALNNAGESVDINGVSENESNDTEASAGLASQVEEVITEGIKEGKVEVNVTEPKEPQAEEVDVQDQSENTIRVAGSIEKQAETNDSSPEQGGSFSSQTESKEKPQTNKEIKIEQNTQTVSTFDNFRNIAPETPVAAAEPLSQVDTQNIIRQINDYMRLNVSGPETSLEMQLNPANLGRVNINISVREGMVTAQLAVENAAVKQALESQMVTLRENMNNQGLKVEAVEVTIASHEFEQNLENGAPTGQQQSQPGGEGRQNERNRNLNLQDLTAEGLEEMPEDQKLAAKIMKDNGNSMDLQA
ncbi:MAG: flagellar hook-length control protein FliK [Lachnospiraceae bacterium]|nr:flagellar hook-length control protein FliK [Lachnospiraceae bacterium]